MFCPFVLFLLAIVLSVLLRYTDSDYSFGIFKLFLHMKIHRNQIINISLFSQLISDGGLFHHFKLYLQAFSWVILLVAGQVVKKPGFCQFTLLFPLIHLLFHLQKHIIPLALSGAMHSAICNMQGFSYCVYIWLK